MNMLSGIKIKNFRGFKNISCQDFGRINILVGKNNVGKTAFLEAILLFFGRQNPSLAMTINGMRGLGSIKLETNINIESPWSSLFYNFDSTKIISISCTDKSGEKTLQISVDKTIFTDESIGTSHQFEKILKIKDSTYLQALSFINSDNEEPFQILITNNGIRVNKPGFSERPAFYISSRGALDSKERAELFTKIDSVGRSHEIIDALQNIEPRLKRLSIGIIADEPIILGDIGAPRLIPLLLMGEGMMRLLDILIRIINCENGAIMIDEIENGLHHSSQEKIWTVIGIMTQKYNVQIFASTHSLECVKNAYLALSELPDDVLRVHRIERAEDETRVKSFNISKLQTLFDLNLEVR